MQAAVYVRISKDDGGRSLGVRRQEADCRALCERNGWDVAKVYVDNDVASKAGVRRPAFERLVADLKDGQFGALVVYHPDRLTRRPVELESLIDLIDASRVKVATVAAGDYDLSTASGRLVARVLGAAARAEVERMGERIARKKRELCEAGLPVGGGRRSYGYTRDGLHLVEAEAKVLRASARRILGGASYYSEVQRLTAAGHLPDSGRWSVQSLRSALTGHRAAGLATHHGKVVADAQWPAVLDRATWEALRSLRALRPVAPRVRFLLTGVAHCVCGTPMYRTATRGDVKPSYTCHKPGGGCGRTAISAHLLEPFVLKQFEKALPKLARRHSPTSDLGQIETAIEKEQGKLAGYAARLDSGSLELVEWEVLRAGSKDRLANLRAQRTRAVNASLASPVLDVEQTWAGGDVVARNGILRRLLRVTVEPAGRGRRVPVADRVTITPLPNGGSAV